MSGKGYPPKWGMNLFAKAFGFAIQYKKKLSPHMLTRDMVTRNWKSFTKELSNKELSQLSIHCLRSTFASEMRKRGCSATEIREAMGV